MDPERRTRQLNKNGLSRHHMFFYAAFWESHPNLKSLRSNEHFIPEIGPDEHDGVHEAVSYVPPISPDLAARVLKSLRAYRTPEDSIQAAENFQRAMDSALKDRRFDDVERVVGEMAAYSIDLQKPYVQSAHSLTIIDLKYENARPSLLWTPEDGIHT